MKQITRHLINWLGFVLTALAREAERGYTMEIDLLKFAHLAFFFL